MSAALVVRTGSDANPPDKPGLANFTVAMLDEGTATRIALQLADDVAQIGATLDTSSTMDASRVQVRSLKKNAAAALDLLADVALHPEFPQEEIERQRGQRLAQLVQQRDDPAGVSAARVMAPALYGPQHPYGYPELGTEAANKAMTRDDMTAFWKQNFVPNNAALVVAGDHQRRGAARAGRAGVRRVAVGNAREPGRPARAILQGRGRAGGQAGRGADASCASRRSARRARRRTIRRSR